MCIKSQKHVRRKQRFIALAFLLCFAVVFLLTETFILSHASHDHEFLVTGGNCNICTQIQTAKKLLRQIGTVVCGVLFSLVSILTIAIILSCFSSLFKIQTQVNLRIRINR